MVVGRMRVGEENLSTFSHFVNPPNCCGWLNKCDGRVLETTNSKDLCLSVRSRAGVTFWSYESFSGRLMGRDLGRLLMARCGPSKFLQCLAGAGTDDLWMEVLMSSKSRPLHILVLNV